MAKGDVPVVRFLLYFLIIEMWHIVDTDPVVDQIYTLFF